MPERDPTDPRRLVPRTDAVLAEPVLAQAISRLGRDRVRDAVRTAQAQVRAGDLSPDQVVPATLASLPAGVTFFGRAWSEATLIRLAYAFEQATHHRRAPTFAPTVKP